MTGHVNGVVGRLRFDSKSCDTRPLKMAATAKRLCSYTVRLVRHAKGRREGHGDAKVGKSCNKVAQVEQLDCSFAEVMKGEKSSV